MVCSGAFQILLLGGMGWCNLLEHQEMIASRVKDASRRKYIGKNRVHSFMLSHAVP
jgi:hypothetical protein